MRDQEPGSPGVRCERLVGKEHPQIAHAVSFRPERGRRGGRHGANGRGGPGAAGKGHGLPGAAARRRAAEWRVRTRAPLGRPCLRAAHRRGRAVPRPARPGDRPVQCPGPRPLGCCPRSSRPASIALAGWRSCAASTPSFRRRSPGARRPPASASALSRRLRLGRRQRPVVAGPPRMPRNSAARSTTASGSTANTATASAACARPRLPAASPQPTAPGWKRSPPGTRRGAAPHRGHHPARRIHPAPRPRGRARDQRHHPRARAADPEQRERAGALHPPPGNPRPAGGALRTHRPRPSPSPPRRVAFPPMPSACRYSSPAAPVSPPPPSLPASRQRCPGTAPASPPARPAGTGCAASRPKATSPPGAPGTAPGCVELAGARGWQRCSALEQRQRQTARAKDANGATVGIDRLRPLPVHAQHLVTVQAAQQRQAVRHLRRQPRQHRLASPARSSGSTIRISRSSSTTRGPSV